MAPLNIGENNISEENTNDFNINLGVEFEVATGIIFKLEGISREKEIYYKTGEFIAEGPTPNILVSILKNNDYIIHDTGKDIKITGKNLTINNLKSFVTRSYNNYHIPGSISGISPDILAILDQH